jgi:hypothetical protein
MLRAGSLFSERVAVLFGIMIAAFYPVQYLHAADAGCPYRFIPTFEEPVRTNDVFDLQVVPLDRADSDPVHVNFGLHHHLYDIQPINGGDLKPGKTNEFGIEVHAGNPGIATLEMVVDGHPECNPKFEFDTGFHENVEVRSLEKALDSEDPPTGSIQSGHLSFPLELVKPHTQEVLYFKEPMLISVSVAGKTVDGVFIKLNGMPMTDSQVPIPLPGSTPVLSVDDSHWGESRTVTIAIYESQYADSGHITDTKNAHVLGTYRFHYQTSYPGVLLLIMTVLGALGYVAVESLPALNKSTAPGKTWWALVSLDRYSKIGVAIAIAIVGFLMAYVPLLKAIKLDQSSLTSYLIYGFCASVMGIEALLKKIKELAG